MNKAQIQKFRAQAHHLKPVVIIGDKGLTENVQLEIDRALEDHELIKIKINANDRNEKKQFASTICEHNNAEQINLIGNILTIYRKKNQTFTRHAE